MPPTKLGKLSKGSYSHGGTPIAEWFLMEDPIDIVDFNMGIPFLEETSETFTCLVAVRYLCWLTEERLRTQNDLDLLMFRPYVVCGAHIPT